MIAANELRIGNWVLIDEDGKWNEYQVEGINLATRNKNIHSFTTPFIFFKIGSVVLTIDGDSEEDGMVKPIPLTTEILEKCGFVRKGHTSSNGSKLVIHHPESFYPNGRVYFNSWAIKNEIPKYLHQLQNLYFALTGEELTVNL